MWDAARLSSSPDVEIRTEHELEAVILPGHSSNRLLWGVVRGAQPRATRVISPEVKYHA